MKYLGILFSFLLIVWPGPPAAAGDIQQGIHGMKWGSSVSEYDELSRVHEADQAAYYANANMIYQSANQPIPGVFYGFYRDQFFAVFIKLRSPDQYSQLERQFTAKHGKPKTTYYPGTRQTVHRWKDDNVKIKLKMKESIPEFKMAIYYAPLAAGLNQEQLENIPSDVYDNVPPEQKPETKSTPLLDY